MSLGIDANAAMIEVKVDIAGHSLQGGERLYCGRSSKYPRYNHGTTISVRDLFYKFPVRQRHWSDASVSKLDSELEKVKRTLETYALITPRVSFTLIDTVKDVKIMACRKADSQLHRITSILGQSLSSALSFVRSVTRDGTYEFSGYISTVGHYNRLCQYFFLNNRPILCENLQRVITHIFQQSSFSKESISYDEDVRRSRERHPVYVLMLRCPTTTYDICADPSKVTVEFEDEDRVIQIVRDSVIEFLERQHLLSRAAASSLRNPITTRKRKAKSQNSLGVIEGSLPLDYVSRIKSSRPVRTKKALHDVVGESSLVMDTPRVDIEDELEFELGAEWMASMLDDDFVRDEVQYDRREDSSIMLPSRNSEKWRRERYYKRTSGIWAQDALRKWVNPVFPTPPSHIPALQALSLDQGVGVFEGGQRESTEKKISRFFSNRAGCGTERHHDTVTFDVKTLQLSKTGLQHAEVISQLDSKFILCTMEITYPSASQRGRLSRVLVVIDQHAADERVRVEHLMKKMCVCSNLASAAASDHSKTMSDEDSIPGQPQDDSTPSFPHRLDTMTMVPALPIALTRREWNLARQNMDWLYRWGIALTRSLHPVGADNIQMESTQAVSEQSAVEEPVMVSHHFSEDADLDSEFQNEAGTSIRHTCQGSEYRTKMVTTAVCAVETDYLQGYVTALPRIVADRCVLDHTLTQDLIKDSISWAEETRYSAGHGYDFVDQDKTDGTVWSASVHQVTDRPLRQ
ncbi:DNA mismatch repair protein [Mortierella sp. GBA30]|nr:DNA mismatch repair protein [Mortierella sp. GBA30]